MDFLRMNLSAALMILVIVGIRKIIKNKVPHIVIGILWCLVIIRLYIPYHIETDFNIYNGMYYIRRQIAADDLFQIGHKMYYFDRVVTKFWSLLGVRMLVFTIWIFGSFFIWRYFLRNYTISKKIWKDATTSPVEKKIKNFLLSLGLDKEVIIKQSNEVDIPMACGVFEHGIILPANFEKCNQKMFEQILLHEYMHLKYWHPLLQHLIVLVLCLNWFNPAIWIFYHFASRDIEISCDKHVLQVIGECEKEDYANFLIHLAQPQNREYALYNGFTKNLVKERIVAIMKFRKLSAITVVLSMLIPVGVVSAFGTDSNYVFGDEFSVGGEELLVEETGVLNEETINVTYEEIAPYIIGSGSRATSTINIERYERTYTNTTSIPTSLKVSMERNGYTYSGTLKLVDVEISGSKYIGYYSGTLYRE